jgi:spore coat protein U-like protein
MPYVGRILITLFAVLFSQFTAAATATGTLSVTASVANTCTVGTGSNLLAFGAYTGAVNNTNGSFQVTCTAGGSYSTALNIGTGSGASFTNRVLTNPTPAGTLNYNIYTTAGRTVVWGDGTGATAVVPGTGTGAVQTVTVFGQIPAGQTATVTPGNYTDTVTITVTFTP